MKSSPQRSIRHCLFPVYFNMYLFVTGKRRGRKPSPWKGFLYRIAWPPQLRGRITRIVGSVLFVQEDDGESYFRCQKYIYYYRCDGRRRRTFVSFLRRDENRTIGWWLITTEATLWQRNRATIYTVGQKKCTIYFCNIFVEPFFMLIAFQPFPGIFQLTF